MYIRPTIGSHSCSLVLVLNSQNAYCYHAIFHSIALDIYKGMESWERIGCANDTISGVMSERADDEKH